MNTEIVLFLQKPFLAYCYSFWPKGMNMALTVFPTKKKPQREKKNPERMDFPTKWSKKVSIATKILLGNKSSPHSHFWGKMPLYISKPHEAKVIAQRSPKYDFHPAIFSNVCFKSRRYKACLDDHEWKSVNYPSQFFSWNIWKEHALPMLKRSLPYEYDFQPNMFPAIISHIVRQSKCQSEMIALFP